MCTFVDIGDPVLCEASRADQLVFAFVTLAWPSFQVLLPLLALLDVFLGLF